MTYPRRKRKRECFQCKGIIGAHTYGYPGAGKKAICGKCYLEQKHEKRMKLGLK